MTTECGSVVSPSLGPESLPHSLTLPSSGMRDERLLMPGINYEGRVSVISPLNPYDPPMRAFTLDQTSNNSFPSPNLHSPPFNSPHGQGFLNPDSLGYPYGDQNNRRPAFHMQPQSHSTPGSSRDIDQYGMYHRESLIDNRLQIKTENVDKNFLRFSREHGNGSGSQEQGNARIFPSSIAKDAILSLPENGNENTGKNVRSFQELPKPPTDSSSLHNMELSDRDYMMNGENSSEPASPTLFAFQENEDRPCSTESDQREVENDPMCSIINTSFDGTQEVFHGENSKSLKCQYCSFSTDSKNQFNTHVNSHFDHKCIKCDYTTRTVEQLKVHLQEEHSLTAEDVEDLECTRVPRVNSQGKVKTFKCKQCGYVAITKSDFWKHAKTHIKSEKLLSCSKCAFVTEYKHHLEYHMRNHFGSKPYKCNKCSYSCVNKSMLNSHMKSHSNIYQYRCSDCSYATKYCHSLKLHLRKYGHTPAMVLNPDGSPNPVPIIDVYGTRRGPKLKKDEHGMPILPPQYQLQAQFVRAHMEATGTIPPAPTAPLEKPQSKSSGSGMHIPIPAPAFPNPFSFSGNIQGYPSFIPHEFKDCNKQPQLNNGEKEHSSEGEEKDQNLNASKSPEVQETFKCEICNFPTQSKDILSHHMLLHSKERMDMEKDMLATVQASEENNDVEMSDSQLDVFPIASQSYAKEKMKQSNQKMPHPFPNAQTSFQEYFARAMTPLMYPPLMGGPGFVHPALELQQQLQRLAQHQQLQMHHPPQPHRQPTPPKEKPPSPSPVILQPCHQTESVLDLSKEQTPPNAVIPLSKEQTPPNAVTSSSHQHSSSSSPSFLPASPPNSDISTPPSKSRRKGRAYKIERIALRLSGEGEEGGLSEVAEREQKEQEAKRHKGNEIPSLLPLSATESKGPQSSVNGKWGEAHNCPYCDIAFKDVVMYTMHMGYHGFKQPYTCNLCGYDAEDKLAFYLHIGRSSHL